MEFIAKWFFVTGFIIFILYMLVKTFFYKSVSQTQEKKTARMNLTLSEMEIMIRKYELQLQRSLGQIEILNQELNALKNEVKVLKSRNSQYRIESDKYKSRIKDLQQKIDALM